MGFARTRRSLEASAELRTIDRLTLCFVGMVVIFAALGAGEAVYRLAFFDFDGATDRLPIETMFGLAFAYLTMKLVRRIYRNRIETSTRIDLIWNRNHKIRHAVDALIPVPYPSNQQAIRVIREEVDRIEGALAEIRPR